MATTYSEEKVLKCSHLIFDIEGTTTSITFVEDTLFPYACEKAAGFLEENWDKEDVQEAVEGMRLQADKDVFDKVEGAVPIPEKASKEDLIKGVVDNLKWLISIDNKGTFMKKLSGLIWEKGYVSGDLKGHVYEDVPASLESWQKMGKNMYIYSSGSVHAQKLLMKYSVSGDLSSRFMGNFDTHVGHKQEVDSYKTIIKSIGCQSDEAVFFTDIVKEAEAAHEAGLNVVLLVREGNAPLTDEDTKKFHTIKSFEEIKLEASSSKRKQEDDQEESRPTKVAKTEEKLTEESAKTDKDKTEVESMETEVSNVETKSPETEAKMSETEIEKKTEDKEIINMEKMETDAEEKEKEKIDEKKEEVQETDKVVPNDEKDGADKEVSLDDKPKEEPQTDKVEEEITKEEKVESESDVGKEITQQPKESATEKVKVDKEAESVKVDSETESVKVDSETESVKVGSETESVKVDSETECVKVNSETESVKANSETESVKVDELVPSTPVIVDEESKSSLDNINVDIAVDADEQEKLTNLLDAGEALHKECDDILTKVDEITTKDLAVKPFIEKETSEKDTVEVSTEENKSETIEEPTKTNGTNTDGASNGTEDKETEKEKESPLKPEVEDKVVPEATNGDAKECNENGSKTEEKELNGKESTGNGVEKNGSNGDTEKETNGANGDTEVKATEDDKVSEIKAKKMNTEETEKVIETEA